MNFQQLLHRPNLELQEQLAFLAHEASKDAGHKPPPRLDDFLREIKTLTVVDEVPAPGPTDEGQ